jgi:hypothetical protein
VQAHDCQLNDSDREDLGDWCALLSSLSRAPARLRRSAPTLTPCAAAAAAERDVERWAALARRACDAARANQSHARNATFVRFGRRGRAMAWGAADALRSDARWWGMEFYLRLPDGTAAADERKANGDADGGLALDAEVSL